jgi:hypothetical protein
MTRTHRTIIRFALLAVLVAGWNQASPASAVDATNIDAWPITDCSTCGTRLNRALNALTEVKTENARLREKLTKTQKLLYSCREGHRECRAALGRTRQVLGECREKLGKCAEGIVKCRARYERCSYALGECHEDLEQCEGGQCCDPSQEPGTNGNPFCFEGATCCGDGTWACNQADGSSSCAGPVADVCEACCDPSQEPGTNGNPLCFEGATCCDDGTWACNQGDGSPSCDVIGHVCESDPDPCYDTSTGAAICCLIDGERIPLEESFPAGDGCNVCTCLSSGQTICSLRPCIEPAP